MNLTNDLYDATAQEESAPQTATSQIDRLLQDDATLQGLQELIEKIEPLIAGGRLNRLVDLMSVTADLVDMSDEYMIEKLAKAFEDTMGAAWTAGNAARMARQQVTGMKETPSLVGLLRIAREPSVRRGLTYMLAMAGVLGQGLSYDDLDYTED